VPTACIVLVDQHVTFAPQTSLVNQVEAIGRIRSACNEPDGYQISISDGLYAQGSDRHMRHASNGDLIRYELYQDASRTQRWGSSAAERWSGPANSGQAHTVYARAFGGQNPSAGTYTDTVVVTVHY